MHHRCTITAVLCRAEAKKLYASKPAFDELGIRLVTVVHQMPKLELEASCTAARAILDRQTCSGKFQAR